MKLAKIFVVCIWMLMASGCATVTKSNKKVKTKDIPALKPVVFSAIYGDVKTSMALLNDIDESNLSKLEQSFVQKYKDRFATTESQEKPKDYVHQIIEVFHSYWHKGLLQEIGQEEGFKWVFSKLEPIAAERSYTAGNFSEGELNAWPIS